MSFTKYVWLPICSQLSTRTAYRNTERPYINFFCCFIDANFWNEVEGKRFVIRDDIPHVAVGYAGLSISKLKKDFINNTTVCCQCWYKKNWNFLTSNVFKTNTLLNDWKKNLIACNLILYQRKMYFRIYICRILYSLVVLVT